MQTSLLVGRELDLAVALELLKRVEGGAPASLLVRGEAGIGKSRLVAELAHRASSLGHPVLSGRADDLDHGIPYAVFRDVLARAGLSLRFEGEVADVFDGTVALLRSVASGPTLLVLEDLHVADRDSLVLAALLMRLADVPVLTVVTLRPRAPGTADLERLGEQLTFDGRGAVVDLERLDRHETQALVAAAIGAAPDDALTDAVFVASGGNPFFAHEAAQSFVDGKAVSIDDGRARLVPDAPALGLRPSTALLRRLFVGTGDDIELAKVMAVFGRFDVGRLPIVERILGRDAEVVAPAFDRLVAAGILVRTVEGFELSHPIVRDTLYEDIGPAERRRIHAAIAAALATEGRASLELASHVAASAEPGDEAAAKVLLDAGHTVAAIAPLVSAGYHKRALEVLPVDSPLRPAALAAQTRALHIGSRPSEAVVAGLDALAVLDDGPTRHATAALVAGDLYLEGRTTEAIDVIDAELARGAPRNPLLSLRTNILMQAGRYREAAETFPDARAAITEGAPSAQLLALSHLVQYANHVGDTAAAVELLGVLAALEDARSRTVSLGAHELVAFADWRSGMVARIEEHLATAKALRPDAVTLSIGGGSESALARVLLMRGQWDEALQLLRATAFDLETRGTLPMAHLLLCTVCEILVDRGDLDAAADVAAELKAPLVANVRHTALAQARMQRALGDVDGARAVLERERTAAREPNGSVWKLAEILRELVDIALERDEDASGYVAEVDDLAARIGWVECVANAHRVRAVALGDVDAAHAYLTYAVAEGWEVERAHAALVLGSLDVDPRPNLADAYRAFDAMGAAPWRRRAAAALRARSLTVPRRVAAPASTLSETETQLVRLVRDGLSNRQIATAMHYSPKTIEVYLSRLYAKTGFASRLELIRAVDTGALEV